MLKYLVTSSFRIYWNFNSYLHDKGFQRYYENVIYIADQIYIILGFIAPFIQHFGTVCYSQKLWNITIPCIVFWIIWYFEIKIYVLKILVAILIKIIEFQTLQVVKIFIYGWLLAEHSFAHPCFIILNLSVPGEYSPFLPYYEEQKWKIKCS